MSGQPIPQQPLQPSTPPVQAKVKKPSYKRFWFWLFAVIVVIALASQLGGGVKSDNGTSSAQQSSSTSGSDDGAKSGESDVPAEYASALKKAETYSDTMHMSKQGIYDQLTSEYGEKFSAEAAQYAIDTIDADWNQNALDKAKTYQDDMSMSPEAIRDQLTSEHGEKFTAKEADYAVAHLND
ncbi:MAG: hypothetical protein ACFWT0_01560 [Bifidobacterium crudilactis]|jgi:hypothetical protein|uniref:Ltp family lipoprotein n=1 Tax=Bifidobacterium crudilactis TaxID=327277 RepID=UPI003A5C2D6D